MRSRHPHEHGYSAGRSEDAIQCVAHSEKTIFRLVKRAGQLAGDETRDEK